MLKYLNAIKRMIADAVAPNVTMYHRTEIGTFVWNNYNANAAKRVMAACPDEDIYTVRNRFYWF